MAQHFGQIVLALLAYDRYRAVDDPVNYMAENMENKTRMRKRIAFAFVVVFGVVSLGTFGDFLIFFGIMNEHGGNALKAFVYLIQTVYLIISLTV